VTGGNVHFNDRYAWEGTDYAPLRDAAPLWLFARDGTADYWAADLQLHPPRLRYRFGLDTADGRRWFGADGLRDVPAPRGAFEFAYLAEGDRPDSPEWARGAVFYHIFPDRFARSAGHAHRRAKLARWDSKPARGTFLGGDLDGIVERLDHISSLGVDALYLTPIFTAPSNHKYDTADFFTVDPDFGGNPALRRLVDALHGRGMRLVLDGVFNHVGATWPPFVDVRQNGDRSPYARWFYFDGDTYETWSTNVTSLPKLRTSDPEVRDLVCRIGRFWVQEYGVDGWRLDVANEVDHALWRAFKSAVREVDREAFLVGEVWDAALPWLRGDQFDSTMNYPLRNAVLRYAGTSGVASPLAAPLDGEGFLNAVDRVRAAYPEPIHDLLYNLLGSHDEVRPLTALREDRRAFALASSLLYALPGIVSVYYGDEVGLAGGNDPLNRGGMAWEKAKQDRRLLDLHRRLGRLRREVLALRRGTYRRLWSSGETVAFARVLPNDRVVVVANAGLEGVELDGSTVGELLGGVPETVATLGYDSPRRRTVAGGGLALARQSVTLLRAKAPMRA
jgi:cyclomaltodextrinase / maltogenic alpha-amylase / neopullulanase